MPSGISTLQALVVELRATIAAQRATIMQLQERVRDLETRVRQHLGELAPASVVRPAGHAQPPDIPAQWPGTR